MVYISDIFKKESILAALTKDKWILNQAEKSGIDVSKIDSVEEFINHIDQPNYVHFKPYSFTIYKYYKEENKVAVRLVGKQYNGFNHYNHIQIGLLLIPTREFEIDLKERLYFTLGRFKNGLEQK